YATTTDAEHDAFNRVASNVAVLLLAWVAIGLIAAYRSERRENSQVPRGVLHALSGLTIAVLLLVLPITAFAWNYLPELRFVQFPWRWMSVLAVCAMLLTAATAKGKAKWISALAIAVVTIGCARYLVRHTWWDTEDMPTLQAAVQSGEGFEGTDEYDPVGDDHTDLAQKQPHAWFANESGHPEPRRDAQIFVDRWTADHRVLRVSCADKVRVALRLVDYPAWRVTVNGTPATREHAPGTAQMIVPLPAGESRIEIRFTRTLDRTIGGWVSVLAACGS